MRLEMFVVWHNLTETPTLSDSEVEEGDDRK